MLHPIHDYVFERVNLPIDSVDGVLAGQLSGGVCSIPTISVDLDINGVSSLRDVVSSDESGLIFDWSFDTNSRMMGRPKDTKRSTVHALLYAHTG